MSRQPVDTKARPTPTSVQQESPYGVRSRSRRAPRGGLWPVTTALSVWSGLYVVPHIYWAAGGGVGFSALKPSATAREDWEAINAVASVILLIPVAIGLLLPRTSSHRPRALLLAACLAGASIAMSHGVFGIVYRVLNLIGAVDIDGEPFTPTQHAWVIWDLYIFEPWFLIEGMLFAAAGRAAMAGAHAQDRWLLACALGVSLGLISGAAGVRIG